MPLRVIAFDIGEVLVDETRLWAGWADWLGVSRLTLAAALGAVISEGRAHTEAFARVCPERDLSGIRESPVAQFWSGLEPGDLYPDALPCLSRLRAAGYRVAVAGNIPAATLAALRRLGAEADFMASAEEWEAAKPSPAFFARLVATAGVCASEIADVGDRVDNDVLPAQAAGLVGVFLRRGPWGVLHAGSREAGQADLRIDGLDELPAALSRLPGRSAGR